MGNTSSNLSCHQCSVKSSTNSRSSKKECSRCRIALPFNPNDTIKKITLIPLLFCDDIQDELSLDDYKELSKMYFKSAQRRIIIKEVFEIEGFHMKILQCSPPRGLVTPETEIDICNLTDRPMFMRGCQLSQLILSPSTKSLMPLDARDPDQIKREIMTLGENSFPRHFYRGEAVFVKGFEFSVSHVNPRGGFINENTELILSQSLEDMEKVHLLPVIETLPENERGSGGNNPINEKQIVHKYFNEYFKNNRVKLTKNGIIEIKNVSFFVVDCLPPTGIVTSSTEFYTSGRFINASNLFPQVTQRQLMQIILFTLMNVQRRTRINFRDILPGREVTAKDLERNKENPAMSTCRVCLEHYEEGDKVLTMPCLHFYHTKCLNKWLNRKATCPVCNTRL